MVYTITVHLYANTHPDSIPRLKAKLAEASRVYSKDFETISWFVMQDVHDPRAFTIVERFESEAVRNLSPCPASLPRPASLEVLARHERLLIRTTADTPSEPEIPPRKPLLEDV